MELQKRDLMEKMKWKKKGCSRLLRYVLCVLRKCLTVLHCPPRSFRT